MAGILQYPNPAVRRVADPVTAGSEATARWARALTRAAILAKPAAVGLAAPQLGIGVRLIAVRATTNGRFTLVANPTFTPAVGADREVAVEHCLSVDGGRRGYPVERWTVGALRGETPDGGPLELAVEGFLARVAQHEIDHLDGICIPDRAAELEAAPR